MSLGLLCVCVGAWLLWRSHQQQRQSSASLNQEKASRPGPHSSRRYPRVIRQTGRVFC